MTTIMSTGTNTALPDENHPIKTNSNNELSPDDFIKLFLAQLKHQNPMSPTDSSAILQQMSQISTISASKSMQNTMEALEKKMEYAMSNSQIFQASGLIGHQVELESDTGLLGSDKHLHGSAFVPAASGEVTVTVKDTAGNTVRTLHVGPAVNAGLVDFDWNGKDDNGNDCVLGSYKISSTAMVNGSESKVATALAYTVKSVAMDSNGNTVLNVDGVGGVLMKDVIKVL